LPEVLQVKNLLTRIEVLEMKKIILVLVCICLVISLTSCSANQDKSALVQYLHNISPNNTDVYFYTQGDDGNRKFLPNNDVQVLADILAGIESRHITEYEENGAGNSPDYGLHLIVDGVDWGIYQVDFVNGKSGTVFRDKSWWIESEDLSVFMLSLLVDSRDLSSD